MYHDPITHLRLMEDRQRDDQARARLAGLARDASLDDRTEGVRSRKTGLRRVLPFRGRLASSFAILRW